MHLIPWPRGRALVVAGYQDIYHAADDVPHVLAARPIGLEGLDERIVRYNKQKGMNEEGVKLLPAAGGYLLIDLGDDSRERALLRARALALGRAGVERTERGKQRMSDPAVPRSWAELGELLFQGTWDAHLRRHRLKKAFRGTGRTGVGLLPTLTRLGGDYVSKEPHLIRNFRKYAHPESPVEESLWNWLALAAHHGLPTRLLDWTFSPYVALHFATSDVETFEEDGDIWCVDFEETNRSLPERLRTTLREEGSQVFTGEMLWRHARSLPELDALAAEPFVLFLEPPSLDERIVNQAALFSLMSSSSGKMEGWLSRRPETFRRISVPASLKWEIRDKLDQANVTERVLFPGLDGLSLWLTRYYTQWG